MVVEFAYLWSWEVDHGHDSALKPRPCVVVGVQSLADGYRVSVVPITHKPRTDQHYIEVAKGHLLEAGLDGRGCYIVPGDLNTFEWPPRSQDLAARLKGRLPEGFFQRVKVEILKARAGHHMRLVDRDELARDIIESYRKR